MTTATRRVTWQNLERETFDLLVIGGGITGAGIARDAALRGYKVALVEKNDFAAGTSSKSSKLIHGGLRYLQQAEFGLVFEAVNERTKLLKLAPHLVRPMQFLVPAYRGKFPGRIALHLGLSMYDALSKFSAPARHRAFRTQALLAREPGLRPERLTGGVVYYDGITDDARLTLENVLDAKRAGAQILSYARVTRLLQSKDAPYGTIGAEVEDVLDKTQGATIKARVTVNATGPWSDLVLRMQQRDQPAPLLRPTKGSHVVVDWARLPVRHAVVLTAPQDGRVMFAIPWTDPGHADASRTVIGTTDTDYRGDPDRVAADAADVSYLLGSANHFFPQAALTPDDVLATWSGLRPLVAPGQSPEELSASSVSREHRILSRPGLLTIVGGKLTTYRLMAAQLVEAAEKQLGGPQRPCPTGDHPLPGAEGLLPEKDGLEPAVSVAVALEALELPAIDGQVASYLAHTYGSRALPFARRLQNGLGEDHGGERLDPELPYLLGEVDLAIGEEDALRLDDVLSRRLPMLLRARDQGLGCAERVARRMARLLSWTPEQTARELEVYRDTVALSRQYRATS